MFDYGKVIAKNTLENPMFAPPSMMNFGLRSKKAKSHSLLMKICSGIETSEVLGLTNIGT